MDANEIRNKVEKVLADFGQCTSGISESESRIERLDSELNSVNKRIGDLIADKRSCRKRDDKWYYQELINDAKMEKSSLIGEIRREKAELGRLRRRLSSTKHAATSLQGRLQRLNDQAVHEFNKVSAVASSDLSRVGRVEMARTLSEQSTFCKSQLSLLNNISDGGNVSEHNFELSGVAESDPFNLYEPESIEYYNSPDDEVSLPCHRLKITDYDDDIDDLTPEEKGTFYSMALMERMGHDVILELGGSALPDFLSLVDGELWITESKGTELGRALHSTGFLRKLKVEDGVSSMYELSPQWLNKSFLAAIARLDNAIERAAEAEKVGLRRMREKYLAAQKDGFCGPGFSRQVIQVGISGFGDGLASPNEFDSRAFDDFCAGVELDKVIQIDVTPSSEFGVSGDDDQTRA